MTDFDNEPKGISRRTIVKGAAWAVPVIAVASTTPAFAASNNVPDPGEHCKEQGEGSTNKFRFYLKQPAIGDTITLTGTALKSSTQLSGFGFAGTYVISGVEGNYTIVFTVTSIDTSVNYPYLLLTDVNATSSSVSPARSVTVTQAGSNAGTWSTSFYSDTSTCAALGWRNLG